METIRSFKGYGKVDELEQQTFRRKTRKRVIILIISSIVLVAVIIGTVIGVVVNKNKNDSSSDNTPATQLTPAASLKAVCSVTRYPDSCFSSISSIDASNVTKDPEILFKLSLQVAMNELEKLQNYPSKLKQQTKDPQVIEALKVCETLFDDALDHVNESLSSMQVGSGEKLLSSKKIQDLKTWLSTSITDQDTCLDALQELNASHYENSNILKDIRSAMQNSTEFASNSLAIGSKILGLLGKVDIPVHRRLLSYYSDSGFPNWVGAGDRRLLQEANPKPDSTVAQDGSGDYHTIEAAVAALPKKSPTRFVIYVKKGTYRENVILDKSKWNVMMYGDGKTVTVVSGSLNFVDGTPTFATATVAVAGRGFIAKDMTFINTAGPEKHQAVAFRSGSDRSVFYRCSFNAYQDTLYAHSNRQFYRDCDITGTIDFIFGNAAVVFQNCNIMPRQPLPNQFNTITAQGKKDPNQNTGISIQKCTLSRLDDKLTAATYLGRPWKEFSTTVIMQSTIGPFLNALGWKEWVSGVDPPTSIFYAEYQNVGLASNTSGRVKWAGYRPTLTIDEAAKFTVGNFIQGSEWLAEANVQYQESL
ncbi:Pectinesterase 1 [Citrus sinensis]|uniref:Pectinesterase 1 n=1 Tax=Citrus sinensis TaxID=2711 RepID=A0ACB8J8M5_CITSI|nr:Pectinesterase 1 [Citrus sinensis]